MPTELFSAVYYNIHDDSKYRNSENRNAFRNYYICNDMETYINAPIT